jgi:hypothetical protein
VKPETKKPWEKDPVTKAEWAANQAAIREVDAVPDERARFKIMKRIRAAFRADHIETRRFLAGAAKVLVARGLLTRPAWHDRSQLHLGHFHTHELAEALVALVWPQTQTQPTAPEEDPF